MNINQVRAIGAATFSLLTLPHLAGCGAVDPNLMIPVNKEKQNNLGSIEQNSFSLIEIDGKKYIQVHGDESSSVIEHKSQNTEGFAVKKIDNSGDTFRSNYLVKIGDKEYFFSSVFHSSNIV